MNDAFSLKTRREFLRATLLGGSLAWTVPSFLAKTFSELQAEAAASRLQAVTGLDANILVVVQLAGGNDGLNTVIPFANDHYHRARPKLGTEAGSVLKLNDSIGLHPSLAGFKALYDAGSLAILQGVGYPNPNRSHFRSTEIWQTASDAAKIERYGWLGRYFDSACQGCDPTVGINIGRQMPQAFSARKPIGVSLENPDNYRLLDARPGEIPAESQAGSMEDSKLFPEEASNSGATIGAVHGTVASSGSPLDFLERTALDAQVSSEKIRAIHHRTANKVPYPQSALGQSLKLVARLIAGGLPTRVFYVSQGGYDTHTNQFGAHQRLLQDLGDSLKAFCDDLKAFRQFSRVAIMTFSEFGRRVEENASGGTDHGAAAPMFVLGEKVKAGVIGAHPGLSPGDLLNGDLKYSIDFRSVYAGLLERWLQTSSEKVLGRKFAPTVCV